MDEGVLVSALALSHAYTIGQGASSRAAINTMKKLLFILTGVFGVILPRARTLNFLRVYTHQFIVKADNNP